MPKPHTFPILFDNLISINIKSLTKPNLLKPNQNNNGSFTWSRNGLQVGAISFSLNINDNISFIELNYKCNEVPIKYSIELEPVISNLKKGLVWYFVCPQTLKRCRKLYLVNGYFLHRTVAKTGMYESQTLSKRYRQQFKLMGLNYKSENSYCELYKKNFKKTYAGKPTKRYLRIMEQIHFM